MILLFLSSLLLSPLTFAEPLSELELLKELVSISSGSADVAGVNKVQEKIAKNLEKMGFSVQLIDNPDPSFHSGKFLVGTLKGEVPQYITLVGHADTVFEKLNPLELSADGKILKGSGVSDNKGGVVVGLSALNTYLAAKKPHYSLRFAVSPSEETGSQGFGSLFNSFAKDSVLVIGLEPARETGNFVISRKGSRWYKIKVTGKEAHAGVDHQTGINACHELSLKLAQLQALTNYTTGTTVSIGHIEGGKDKFNIVCGEAVGKIDIRYSNSTEAKKVFAKVESILSKPAVRSFKDKTSTTITYEVVMSCPAFAIAKNAKPYIQQYINIVKSIEGKTISGESTGGASDLNSIEGTDRLVMLDGLGPVGGGYHSNAEFVNVPSLKTRAQALFQLIDDFTQ